MDDEADTREIVTALLSDMGYDVQTAANGQLALDALAVYVTPQPRVMLLDMTMPVMGGTEVLRALAASGRLATLHVVVISGQVHEAKELGAKRVLRKPVSLARLLAAVREGCGECDTGGDDRNSR